MLTNIDECTFRVLGPVQVTAAGRTLVFARRQHLDLLAFLLLHAERVVTVSQLIDAMWAEAVPRTAAAQIKNMLSALRAALADAALATIDRHPAGYRLRILAGQLDVDLFTARVGEARAAPSPAAAAETLRRALDLWQGSHALTGVRAAFADAARARLAEQRSSAREALFDAELARGNHAGIIAELTEVVADDPGRERFVAQLMIALYRSGRAPQALAAYRQARRALIEEYGVEPGLALRDLERMILADEAALYLPATEPGAGEDQAADEQRGAAGRPTLPVPAQLPPDVRGFAGRSAELTRLNALVTGKPAATLICLLVGTAGVGKTTLAVHWAHQLAERFPDGQLYVNLRGFDPTGPAMTADEALRGFIEALGVAPERIPTGVPAQSALYRSLVAGRRVLIVLDNALDAAQVRPLLPGMPGCLAVVTSRNQLTGLVAAEGAYPLTLDVLTEFEARELLVGRLGPEPVAAEPRAVQAIAQACARLPLALAIVAARAAIRPAFPLARLAEELSRERGRLSALAGDDATGDIRAVFSWSYHRLGAPAARLFRLLGLHRGPDLGPAAAASLGGVPVDEAARLLAELAHAHLVAERTPGRYALHDLLRAYAAELARDGEPAEQSAAVHRLLGHYLHSAYAAGRLLYPHRSALSLPPAGPGVTVAELADRSQALAWFTAEHPALVGAVDQASEADLGTHAWQLASILASFLDRRGHWHDWVATQQAAVAATARTGDHAGQAQARGSLGLACGRIGRYREAHHHLDLAFALLGELDDRVGQAYLHLRTSSVYEGEGDHAAALRHAQAALALYCDADHAPGRAQALNTVGWYHARLGRYRDAIDHCERALALHRALGDRQGEAHTLDSLGYAHHHLGEPAAAAGYYRRSLALLRDAGDQHYEAIALGHLGDAYHCAGDAGRARDAWRQAVQLLDRLGHPDADDLRARLRTLDATTPPPPP